MSTAARQRPQSVVPTIVCWKWKPAENYRSKFEACHVNTFARMIRRNVRIPVEVVCITDDAAGITECDRVLPLWNEFAEILSPHPTLRGRSPNPSCYRRLRMFAADAREWLGKRIVSMDLDCVVTGDITGLLTRREPFLAWGDTNPTTYYNGGLVMFDAGAVSEIYDGFRASPKAAIAKAQQLGQWGSDQGWIGACLGPHKPKLGTADGVYSYRLHVKPRSGHLPSGARLVMFHGLVDPDHSEAQRLPWVREHYR